MSVSEWISEYKVGLVESLRETGGKGTKVLKICTVDVGGDNTLTVVTAATNVRQGSRLAVAPVGSTILGGDGEPLVVTKTSVGGHASEGIFCDSRMLGWDHQAGTAARMDDSLALGSVPPATKPRPGGNAAATNKLPESTVEGLYQKKLTKEEKKKLNEEKKKARKAAKAAKAAAAAAEAAKAEN